MGNENSSTGRTSNSDPNLVILKKEVFQKNRQKIQSLEKQIQDNKTVIRDKNITIYSCSKANAKFQSENWALRNEKLQLTQSKNEISKKCEQLEEYNKTLTSEIIEYKSMADNLRKSNLKFLGENSTLRNEKLHLTQSKNEISEKCEQLEKYNKTLIREMVENKSESDTLMKTNNKLLCENYILENEKLYPTQSKEIKNKCEQLEKHNETFKSELVKYESIPALKQILGLFENLQVFQQDIKKAETDILIEEQNMNSMLEKFSNKKKENNKIEDEVKQKSLNLYQITQLTEAKEQIIQAEKTLETINNSHTFLDYKQKVSSITEEVKMCVKEFDNMSESINKIEEQLKDHKKEFVVLQNKGDKIMNKVQEECEKILTLLDKQYNVLWDLLYLTEPESESHLEKNLFLDESEGVFLSTDGKKYYAIMLYNLEEGPNDQQKVFDIIHSICSISTKEIEVQRLGAQTRNKTRPIKVSMPTFLSVSMILSKKWKLKTGDYQHIKLGPFNKKRVKTAGKQVHRKISNSCIF